MAERSDSVSRVMGTGEYQTAGGHRAFVTTVSANGRLYGHVLRPFTKTW